MIEMENISKSFFKGKNEIKVLKNINLTIQNNEMVALMGRSGSGKSTIINILSCLLYPKSGKYKYNGKELTTLKAQELDKFRESNIGIITQDYSLINSMTAFENISLPLKYRKVKKEEIEKRIKEISKKLSIEHCLDKKVYTLSGGESQRVAIARAVVKNPTLILADEPTGALDKENEIIIMELLKELSQNCSIIIATHSETVSSFCNKTILIDDGLASGLVRV